MSAFLKGMDISTLHEVETFGGRFFDDGREAELLDILESHQVNAIRLRVWNDPCSEDGKPYLGGGCDLEVVTALAKRVVARGMQLLLDIHYSDFWVDPGKQTKPKAWKDYTDEQLVQAVYDWTARVLTHLRDNGVTPELIQVGNEITNGMLWPNGALWDGETPVPGGYDRLAAFLKAGVQACREQAPDAKIVLHLERSGDNETYRTWFDNIAGRGVDFDVIGMSYYPYWHGPLDGLENNIRDMQSRYGREVMIVETSYAFTTKAFDRALQPADFTGLVVNDDTLREQQPKLAFPLTPDGQVGFMTALLDLCQRDRVAGLFYWEPAWLPVKGTSWASKEARAYIGEEHKSDGNEWANQGLFDYDGNALPALKVMGKYRI